MTIAYLPVPATRYGDYLEDLARAQNDGWDSAAEARPMCPLLPAEDFPLAWQDFCEAVRNRDDVTLGTRHWSEVLDTDAAATHEHACELLAERADEALLVLRTGIRK
jgi:hypothetical protein